MRPIRDFLLLAPSRPAPDLQLLVLIHGCRQDAESFALATGAARLVETGQWAVLLPDQRRAANMYRCWNWFDERCVRGGGEVAIVMAAIDEARRLLPRAPSRCVIAGLSSGAALTAALVAHHPAHFSAAAMFAGLPMGAADAPMRARQAMANGPARDVTLELPAQGRVPVLVVHGDRDQTVALANADALVRQALAINGVIAPGEPLPAGTPVGASDETLPASHYAVTRTRFGPCERLIVHGMGHAWSGGDSRWKYFDPDAPDGLELIVHFASQHGAAVATDWLAAPALQEQAS